MCARVCVPLACPHSARSVHTALARGEAEALLKSQGLAAGVFLLRAKGDGTHVMTICTSASQSNPKFVHFVLDNAPDGSGIQLNSKPLSKVKSTARTERVVLLCVYFFASSCSPFLPRPTIELPSTPVPGLRTV